ncbi:MAG: PD-(D/E)XK nuclease family protein [Treponema sp.]|nr:PD-(D/E)XK nuclease family protein [Treponema sp.]
MQNLESVLSEQITNNNAVFVFPTDVACNKWADWCIENTDTKAVAMERFMAWDKFKGERIRGKSEDLKSVPSLMRKIFVSCLIEENAEKHFFKSLISREFAGEASGFADWISSILPSLKMWKNLRDAQKGKHIVQSDNGDEKLSAFYEEYKKHNFTDEEDEDFSLLYERYRKFLDKNGLFDPAWVEPDFSGDGREYFLVYPETLEDWEQYRHKLSLEKSVHFIEVPEEEGEYESLFFENSSLELRAVARFLREKHDKEKISWSDMAVNVPNLDNYGSYLDRTLSLYEIPHTIRYSRPLSTYGAGSLFSQISECVEKAFSYESVKNLLLNEDLPWANKATIENLLLFGKMNNCICTSGETVFENGKLKTVWDEAFSNPKNDNGTGLNKDELIKNLYNNLAELLPPMVHAKKFSEIRSAYEKFRETFFDMASFQEMELSNNVLSRCITTLNEIVDLEERFPDYKISSPYSFFVSHLSRVQYLSQGESRSLQVYPYRSAAAAPYKIQVVVDSTQDSLSVADSFKPLDFLNDNKRRLFIKMGELDSSLGFADCDPTFDFVKMYQYSSTEKTFFTASRHAYNGNYGFAYGKMEKTVIAGEGTLSEAKGHFKKQYDGFQRWKARNMGISEDSGHFVKDEKFMQMIQARLHCLKENLSGKKQKNPLLLGKIEITQSTLKQYFSCPRKWLFKNVLRLSPLDNEAELIDQFIIGKVNHKIFENFFTHLKEKKLKLCKSDDDKEKLSEEYLKLLVLAVNEALDASENAKKSVFKEIYEESEYGKKTVSTTTIKVISSQYRIDDEKNARKNANFRELEKSLAHLCDIFSGYKVYALEKSVQALPDSSATPQNDGGYYLSGEIDCVLSSPNESEFAIVDFKTSSMPSNLTVKAQENGKKENVIDFQLPLYIYLLKNNVEEKERLEVSTALFYSIKNTEEKNFLGNAPNGKQNEKISGEEVKLAISEMLSYAKRFYEEVSAQEFAVNALNQSRNVCTAKGEFDNCIDYHALCRRYFAVAGEET